MDEAPAVQLRSSARVSKKLKLDQEAAAALAAQNCKKEEKDPKDDAGNQNSGAAGQGVEEKPKARCRVIWTQDEKNTFFEALNEHGKNFDEIEKFMATRAKRRSDINVKNRERVRHFFHRTWQKISKHVHFPETVKKTTQELYALINFGELRKKVGYVNEKNAQKLNELIYSGCTQVRVKGKTWRVKTPVCRALRKLNHFEDDCEEVKLPSRVEILLHPRSIKDAARVQWVAHNPRVRTTMSLDTTLSSLLQFLHAKWSVGDQEQLKIGPRKDAVPVQATFKCGQVVTSSSVSLLAHEKRVGGEGYDKVKSLLSQLQVGKTKSMLKWQRDETAGDDQLNSDVVDPASFPSADGAPNANRNNQNGSVNGDGSTGNLPAGSSLPTGSQESGSGAAPLPASSAANPRDGWNRIGQLYLMYGSKGVLELEYWFEEETPVDPVHEFSKALARLASLAKIIHYKTKVECPCGHVCKPAGNSHQNKSSKAAKSVKIVKNEPASATVGAGDASTSKFKQPLPADEVDKVPMPQPAPFPSSDAMAALLQRTKYCHRRGRHRQRPYVVQRMLPLLPKTKNPTSTPSHPSQVVVAVQIVPSSKEPLSSVALPVNSIPTAVTSSPLSIATTTFPLTANGVSPNPLVPVSETPPPIFQAPSSFRGILSATGAATSSSDPIAVPTSTLSSTASTEIEMTDVTPPVSPSRILKEGEGEWLNSEVTDFSLSSFLGHLESPMKLNGATAEDNHRVSPDMDVPFQSLMGESSLDYSSKFADLAKILDVPSLPP